MTFNKLYAGNLVDPSVTSLSVISVVYNDLALLKDTIASVAVQDSKDFEFIVIDGNSSDGTSEFLRLNQQTVDKYISESDKGIYDAMNKGLALASGEYILFLGAGDLLLNNKTISNINAQLMTKRPPFLIFRVNFYKDDASHTYNRPYSNKLISRGEFSHQGFVYRKSIHEMCGLYCAERFSLASDYYFFQSVKKLHPFLPYIDDMHIVSRLKTGKQASSSFKVIFEMIKIDFELKLLHITFMRRIRHLAMLTGSKVLHKFNYWL